MHGPALQDQVVVIDGKREGGEEASSTEDRQFSIPRVASVPTRGGDLLGSIQEIAGPIKFFAPDADAHGAEVSSDRADKPRYHSTGGSNPREINSLPQG
jgi:hypothetical protein